MYGCIFVCMYVCIEPSRHNDILHNNEQMLTYKRTTHAVSDILSSLWRTDLNPPKTFILISAFFYKTLFLKYYACLQLIFLACPEENGTELLFLNKVGDILRCLLV